MICFTQKQRGTALMEMALVLWAGTILLACVLLLGRLTWHAIALQKAVASTGRFLSTLPVETLRSPDVSIALNQLAGTRVREATLAAGLDAPAFVGDTNVRCTEEWGCGSFVPTEMQVGTTLVFRDPIFGTFSGLIDTNGIVVLAQYRQAYVSVL